MIEQMQNTTIKAEKYTKNYENNDNHIFIH